MRTSLDHLPPKKQDQLRALVDLIREHVDVEMVILFGSYARGDWVEDLAGGYFSDFDVLVIVGKASTVERHKLWSKIESRAQRITKPTVLSLIVHDIDDVNEQLEKGHYFFSDLKREGIVLYDSKRHRLAAAKKMTPQSRLEYAKTNFDEWFGSAEEFYGTFEFDLGKGWNKTAAFLLHQATERLYHRRAAPRLTARDSTVAAGPRFDRGKRAAQYDARPAGVTRALLDLSIHGMYTNVGGSRAQDRTFHDPYGSRGKTDAGGSRRGRWAPGGNGRATTRETCARRTLRRQATEEIETLKKVGPALR